MPRNQISAADAPSDKHTEPLIAEPLCLRINLDRNVAPAITHGGGAAANSQAPLPPETTRIVRALRRICEVKIERTFMLNECLHKILPANGKRGTRQMFRENCIYGARIAVAPVARKRQHIYVEFYVMRNIWDNGEPDFYLECEGTPTTVMTGNNVRPVTIRDRETGDTEPYPSSSPQVLNVVNRSLFHFLEVIAEAVAPSKDELFSAETREAINDGDCRVSHIQWACYFATPAAPTLKILSAMFMPPTDMGEGHPSLAECLGLDFERKTKKLTHRLKSILLIKRQGDEIAWSLSFYDKSARIGQMKQGGTLRPAERNLIDTHVRVDVTAQARAIRALISAAQSFLKKHSALFAQLPEAEFAEEFIAQEVKPTLRLLEFAVFVLSHREVGGKLVRGSFADYLIPTIFDKVIPLRRIVAFFVEGLRAMERSTDEVAVAWRSAKMRNGGNWVKSLCAATGFHKSKVYKDRERFWRLHKIDISIPYAFYRRFELHPSISLLTDDDRDALKEARIAQDGEAVLRLLEDTDAKFFTQMKTLVADPILQPPVSLPAKVLGEIELSLPAPKKAIQTTGTAAAKPNGPTRKFGARSYEQPWTPKGLDSRMSIQKLLAAMQETKDQIAKSSSPRALKRLRRRGEWIAEAIVKKRRSIKLAKKTRRLRKLERPPIKNFRYLLRKLKPSADK